MNRDEINEVEKKYPDEFKKRLASGLGRETVAPVVLAQAEHDKNNPPEAAALARARSIVEVANSRLALWAQAHAEAAKALSEAEAAGVPASDLPALAKLTSAEPEEAPTPKAKQKK